MVVSVYWPFFFEKLKLKENLTRIFPVCETSPNALPVYNKILSLMLTVLAGGERYSHMGYLSSGKEVLAKLFGIEKMPRASSTLTRLFLKVRSYIAVEKLAEGLWSYMYSWIPFEDIKSDWFDFDSTVITRYGNQEGARKGYNPKKKGRPSHHPLIAFLSKSRFIINLWNRSGNTKSANNILGFFDQTHHRIKDRISIKGIRADAGFYIEELLDKLEQNHIIYIITAVFYINLQRRIWELSDWKKVEDGYEVSSFIFKPEKWKKERRYIAIRREINKLGGKAVGKQLTFFDLKEEYTYSCFVTSDKNSTSEQIWRDYRPRANDENVIKEYKEDFALGGFCHKKFYATEAGMLIRALIFNILNLFKRDILFQKAGSTKVERLKTLRFKYFVIPAYMGSGQNYDILRLSIISKKLKGKMQCFLSRLTNYFPAVSANCNAVNISTHDTS